MKIEPLVIACAADRRYGLPLAVMLTSAAMNLDLTRPIDVYIADGGIDREIRTRISASLPARVALHWLPPERTGFVDLPLWGRMTIATYDKLALGRWLPEFVKRVVWLDSDLMVLCDLTRLWELSTKQHCVQAVQDVLVRTLASRFGVARHRELGLDGGAEYFNAGVMLIDVARWRLDDVAGRALAYLKKNRRRVFFWDQEALNASLAGQWGKLDPRWNWNAGLEHPVVTNSARQGQENNSPWIVHFAGTLKPWRFQGRSGWHELYYHYLDLSAWAGWRPVLNWRSAALSRYEASRFRHLLFPLERVAMEAQRAMTLRYVSAEPDLPSYGEVPHSPNADAP